MLYERTKEQSKNLCTIPPQEQNSEYKKPKVKVEIRNFKQVSPMENDRKTNNLKIYDEDILQINKIDICNENTLDVDTSNNLKDKSLTPNNKIPLTDKNINSQNIMNKKEIQVSGRIRRGESIKALEKIEQQISKEKTKIEMFEKIEPVIEQSPFCGIKRTRKNKNIAEITNLIVPLNNSSKNEIPNLPICGEVNSNFFLDNVDFLKVKKPKSKRKKYTRARRRNTKLNSGYKTVSPKRLAVVDICQPREISFDFAPKQKNIKFIDNCEKIIHNSTESILCESKYKGDFEWKDEKKPVEIIRRINLHSESRVADDLEFIHITEAE